jgi:hypothetical protein
MFTYSGQLPDFLLLSCRYILSEPSSFIQDIHTVSSSSFLLKYVCKYYHQDENLKKDQGLPPWKYHKCTFKNISKLAGFSDSSYKTLLNRWLFSAYFFLTLESLCKVKCRFLVGFKQIYF